MNNLEKLINDLSNYWDLSPEKVVDRLNHMNESEIKNVVNKMTKKFKNGGLMDCLRNGGSVKDCGCGAKVEKNQSGTTGDGLTVQTPKSKAELFWENIRSSRGSGKAAKRVSRNGRWEITKYDYPDVGVIGNGNDHTLYVRRDPQTGIVSNQPQDSLVRAGNMPIVIPINKSMDAPTIRSARVVGKKMGGNLPKKNTLPKLKK